MKWFGWKRREEKRAAAVLKASGWCVEHKLRRTKFVAAANGPLLVCEKCEARLLAGEAEELRQQRATLARAKKILGWEDTDG